MVNETIEEQAEAQAEFTPGPCPKCGKLKGDGTPFQSDQAWGMHWNMHCAENPDRARVSVEQAAKTGQRAKQRSKRGAAKYGLGDGSTPTILEQVEPHPGGAWAYYVRGDGATVAEALVCSPNGGAETRRLGKNAEYYRGRQRKRGLEFIGSSLTEAGIRKLIEVLQENRGDYAIFLDEEIGAAQALLDGGMLNADQMARERRRIAQLRNQLRLAKAPLNVEGTVRELNEIARAQKLSSAFSRDQFEVLKTLLDDRLFELAQRYAEGRAPAALTEEYGSDSHVDLSEEKGF